LDYERKLINKVAQSSNIESLLLSGIKEEHFAEEEHRDIYAFLAKHFRDYKVSPSLEITKEAFPDHLFEIETDALEYLKDEFLKLVKRRSAMTAIRDLAEAIDDPEQVGEIDALFLEKSRELSQVVPVAQISKFKDMDTRIAKYEAGEDNEDGIAMGIPEFDFITAGIQPHEYVTISGFSGTGKSTLAQWMLFNAYMQGKTPMYISLEMEAKALLRKWDTMMMNFEYHRLKRGTLRNEDVERWKEQAETVRQADNDIIILDDVAGCTVDRVYAELTRYQPDILCIDYITLMDTPRSAGGTQMWEKVVTLTRQLKQTARTLGIPIIGVAQTNRSGYQAGAQLDNIAFSQSIVNDSDIILGLQAVDDEMRANNRLEVALLKNRDGRTETANLLWKMDTMEFGQWREVDAFMSRETGEIS
jgi:replicative DNA helicase